MIDQSTPVPPYLQLAAIIRGQVQRGELTPGERLPSILVLSQKYDMSQVTVKKTIRVLKAEGLVEGVAGYGTFIRGAG
jgi:GntR family transcriptional regulator